MSLAVLSASCKRERGDAAIRPDPARSVEPTPPMPAPSPSSSALANFDVSAARATLRALDVAPCGSVKVTVVPFFKPDGSLETVDIAQLPLPPAPVVACLRKKFSTARVPPFHSPPYGESAGFAWETQ